VKFGQRMSFGAQVQEDGTRFRLWAPSAKRVVLDAHSGDGARLQAELNEEDGWFDLVVAGLGAGTRYRYRIDDEIEVPDPASRFNPDGVAGASEVIDPRAFEWADGDWSGRDWHEAVLYELHVGTFTREGTYDAASARLGELADLGITAVELMPLAAFAGHHGWGYDGVLPYAPHAAYGRPDDLKRFVQAAHERGLMVLLDVVYNHFGPEGNYLRRYARPFFSARHQTPWGDGIDFSQPAVRQFFIGNALYWLDEYRFDGLRLDAVHAIEDDSRVHFIDELVEAVRNCPGADRRVHIVLENARNEAHRLSAPRTELRVSGAVAQWNDDFHHCLHTLLTRESDGYYCDYADRPVEHLGRVLSQGFAYQGERSEFSGELRGERSADLPPAAFVSFLQNHDQIGNRACGERLAQLAASSPEALDAAFAVLLLSPQIPMLFMGEEYGAPQPFLYFCDYHGELAQAITSGRREEFARFRAFADSEARETIPDPNAVATFERCKLDPGDRARAPCARQLQHTRDLLKLRAAKIAPMIARILPGKSTCDIRGRYLTVHWPAREETLVMQANLGAASVEVSEPARAQVLFPFSLRDRTRLGPWEVRVLLQTS
jgi:maltooligosyltrehalose trehalohydrolase